MKARPDHGRRDCQNSALHAMKHAMVLHARALWITEPGVAEIREELLPAPQPGELLVRTAYSAVSRGTEALVFSGRVPESEYRRMRCPHQAGEFPFPVKYGYINVGRVLDGPEAWRERLVFGLFPHQTLYVTDPDEVVPLPEGVAAERAVLAANMETAINALWDAELVVGDRVSIIGAGVLGCLCAYLARQTAGVEVELVDVSTDRQRIAADWGIGFATPERASTERDLVFHASGTEQGLRTALELSAGDGRIVELSWFGNRAVALPLGAAFHGKRLTLRASQVGQLSPKARPRWTRKSRLTLALELCRGELLDVLIDSESDFESLPKVLQKLAGGAGEVLCHRVRYA
jgi:NADPH:quinone reductase-like Zn-dependent oxidoreductase